MKRQITAWATCGMVAIAGLTVSMPAKAQIGVVGAIAAGIADSYAFNGRNYCFYPDGWNGPGWYWCGYAYRNGYGFGGGEGWHGWRHRGGLRGGRGGHHGGGGHGGGGGHHGGGGHGGGRH